MSKRRRLAALCILNLALPLILVTLASAAPALVGAWSGVAPVITPTGCSNETINVTISTQCTNLFSGTVPIADKLIPVVGKYDPAYGLITLSGTLQNLTTVPYYYYSVSLSGVYVAGTPLSISVTAYMLLDALGNIEDSTNKEYDTFSLIKQTQ